MSEITLAEMDRYLLDVVNGFDAQAVKMDAVDPARKYAEQSIVMINAIRARLVEQSERELPVLPEGYEYECLRIMHRKSNSHTQAEFRSGWSPLLVANSCLEELQAFVYKITEAK